MRRAYIANLPDGPRSFAYVAWADCTAIGTMACFHRFVASSKRLGMSQMVMQRLKSIGLIRSASPLVTRIGGVSDMRQRQGELDQQIRKQTRFSAHTTPQWTFARCEVTCCGTDRASHGAIFVQTCGTRKTRTSGWPTPFRPRGCPGRTPE